MSVNARNHTFTRAAVADMIEARDWYERKIGVFPEQWPIVFKDVRRAPLRRFAYSLFFVSYADGIRILACFRVSP